MPHVLTYHTSGSPATQVYNARCSNRENAADLAKQPYYRHMQDRYI